MARAAPDHAFNTHGNVPLGTPASAGTAGRGPADEVLLHVPGNAGLETSRLLNRTERTRTIPQVGAPSQRGHVQVPEGGANLDIPNLRPTIGVFLSNLGFSSLGDGFQQTMTVEWLSNLEIRAGTEGCEPVAVSCDLAGCSGS